MEADVTKLHFVRPLSHLMPNHSIMGRRAAEENNAHMTQDRHRTPMARLLALSPGKLRRGKDRPRDPPRILPQQLLSKAEEFDPPYPDIPRGAMPKYIAVPLTHSPPSGKTFLTRPLPHLTHTGQRRRKEKGVLPSLWR